MVRIALCLAVVLAAVLLSEAQIKPLCNMPQVFEGRVISFDPNQRSYHNRTSAFRAHARLSYDGQYKRRRIFEEYVTGTSPEQRFDILELYQVKKAYVTNLGTRKCTIHDITFDWHPLDIPTNATFEGFETLGSYPDSVTLSQWFVGNATGPRGSKGVRYKTFTTVGCVPVRSDFMSNATGFTYEEFSDVTLGLHDPNIFIPPTGCTPA